MPTPEIEDAKPTNQTKPTKGRSPEKKTEELSWLMRSKPILKWLIVLVVVAFLILTIRKAYLDVLENREHLNFSAMDWRWLLAGVLAYMIGMMPAAAAWLQTLRAFGQNVPFWFGLHTYFLGHLGKYVPGKAMVIVMRVGRLAPLGIEIKPTVVSIFVETLTSIAVGAIVGSVFIFFAPEFPPAWMVAGAAICIPCSMLLLLHIRFERCWPSWPRVRLVGCRAPWVTRLPGE